MGKRNFNCLYYKQYNDWKKTPFKNSLVFIFHKEFNYFLIV